MNSLLNISLPLRRFWPTVAMFVVLAVAFGVYVYSEKRIDRANRQRFDSFLLADQLRQSSDDLTRMARTYVATGDTRYRNYYREILEIRDGSRPRPPGYFHAYWDLVLAGAPPPQGGEGEAVALLELMRQAGFAQDEMLKLAEAKTNSDTLAAIELEAMQLAANSGRTRALQMLYDAGYHRAKAAIMKPLNDAFDQVDKRTVEQVRAAERTALLFRVVFIACTLGALLRLWLTYKDLLATLGGSVEEVHEHIQRIGRGELSGTICVGPGRENSVLAGLAAMQDRLKSNVAELKKVEADLRTSAERLNEAQHIARIGSWTLYLDSGKLFWSDEIYRLFEIDPSRFDATYEAFLNVIHPDDREAVNKAYSDSLEQRTPYEITHRLLMADGRIKWVQEKCTSDFDPSGKPLRSHGTVQDVTERKQAEVQLRIAASAFESQEGMIVTDANSLILRVNRAFTKLTGYTQEELAGQTPRLFKSGRHNQEFYKEMWDTINRTGGWQGEIWDRRKNGEEYQKWLTISAVKDEDGTVTHYIGAQYDITERKRAEDKINELAYYDQLTGLANRTLMMDRLKQSMSASSRSGTFGALLFIDLDNFKTLNDTLGHDMGDLLLQQVAQRLSASVRAGDTVARLGGDEFVVTLTNLSSGERDAAAHTELIGEKIIAELNRSYQLRNTAYQITPSIGATLFMGHQTEIEVLLKQADLAMYKSKEAGRNTLRFFDPDMERDVMSRVALERDLRRAVQEEQFLPYYQPQLAGGELVGAEVLLRWRHPERGLVSPAEFIPLAEETGLILPLGRWVLETACAQLARWGGRPETARLTMAVNVSAHQFRQAGFVEQVLEVLDRSGADPQLLKLELTESMFVTQVEEMIAKMGALKARGVTFSLDDFGTGYSSLSYLKRLPLDQLKIDQSFVRDVLDDPNDAAIARTIIALGQSLGLAVIAEGVETEAQRDFLADSGCRIYQGYFFSRPLPVADFEAFARQAHSASDAAQGNDPLGGCP